MSNIFYNVINNNIYNIDNILNNFYKYCKIGANFHHKNNSFLKNKNREILCLKNLQRKLKTSLGEMDL